MGLWQGIVSHRELEWFQAHLLAPLSVLEAMLVPQRLPLICRWDLYASGPLDLLGLFWSDGYLSGCEGVSALRDVSIVRLASGSLEGSTQIPRHQLLSGAAGSSMNSVTFAAIGAPHTLQSLPALA